MAPPNSILVIGVALLLTAALTEQTFVNFSYVGVKGPEKWGSLSPYYSTCSKGKSQSPINIVKKDVVYDSKLQPFLRNYTATNVTLINNGFNIGISCGSAVGYANIDGMKYTLKQMHWHSPSEHTINGERFAAELHLVHIASDGSISVVAILFKIGNPDPLLNQMKESLNQLTKETCSGDQEAHVAVSRMKLKRLNKKTRKYFRYVGSLTIPPCYENVTWTVLGKVRDISDEQLKALKAPLDATFKNNSRPVQPLNGRRVQFYNELHSN
ncbi:hypothetical protein IFM89_031399 [Coptis chinensis]|uniref:Carbonic anhydrase n=1 Tax=Coptis chinensis TaxID=261450 RepID=A0A835HGP1_9MAGN|nr:hypothetical protein IFM89_031399 [Coptis chinensis]